MFVFFFSFVFVAWFCFSEKKKGECVCRSWSRSVFGFALFGVCVLHSLFFEIPIERTQVIFIKFPQQRAEVLRCSLQRLLCEEFDITILVFIQFEKGWFDF